MELLGARQTGSLKKLRLDETKYSEFSCDQKRFFLIVAATLLPLVRL